MNIFIPIPRLTEAAEIVSRHYPGQGAENFGLELSADGVGVTHRGTHWVCAKPQMIAELQSAGFLCASGDFWEVSKASGLVVLQRLNKGYPI